MTKGGHTYMYVHRWVWDVRMGQILLIHNSVVQRDDS